MKIFDIIKRPLVTEKSVAAHNSSNEYAFAVDVRATKAEIRNAVETMFKVKVVDVRTLNRKGKPKRGGKVMMHTSAWKKAFVALKAGEKIQMFENA